MNRAERPRAGPLMLRSWVLWLLAAVAATSAWAFIDNLRDRDWFMVGGFGIMTLSLTAQVLVLLRVRRANRRTPRSARPDRRPADGTTDRR